MAEVVVGQALEQLLVLIPGPELLRRLGIGDKGHRPHIGHCQQVVLQGPGLLLRQALVHEGQHLVGGLHVLQHGVGVHRHQGEGPHDQQAGHGDADGGEGHEAVAEHVVGALPGEVGEIVSAHCAFALLP